ncbi:MAG: cellulase family glycosylhydrolase [Sedimentisphaerales bacterium]|jgi:hypothetical protein
MKRKAEGRFYIGAPAGVVRTRLITVAAFAIFYSVLPVNAATPWLHTEGNKIKDPNGTVVVLRGVDTIDLGAEDRWQGGAINMIDRLTNKNDTQGNSPGWYPNVIRLVIYPKQEGDFASPFTFDPNDGNDTYYNTLLRPVVDYCKTKDLYAIIDWHFVGDNTYDRATETNTFWAYMAPKFANDSHVLFELFNEPLNTSGGSDVANWLTCRPNMQTWINIVRTYAPNNLILVAGPRWSQIIAPAASYPLTGNNIVIVSHIYPGHWLGGSQAWYKNQITTCLTVYPVFMSEWGFRYIATAGDHLFGTITDYGQPLMAFCEAHKISTSAWVASYDWEPPIFIYDWTLHVGEGEMGGFLKDSLYITRNDDQPGRPAQLPYGGTAWAIPGAIEAEDYDTGGEDIAYHDTTAGNSGGAYRSDDVDIETCSEGGYDVTGIEAGEWLEYTVNVASAGIYDIEARVASAGEGGSFHIVLGNTDVTGPVDVPDTGGEQTFASVHVMSSPLTAGQQVMRFFIDSGGWNLNYIKFTKLVSTGTIPLEVWNSISGTLVSNLTSNINYPRNPSLIVPVTCLRTPYNWSNNYGTRMRGFLHPTTTGEYTFWIASYDSSALWLSTDADPINISRIAYVPDHTDLYEWDKYDSQMSSSIWMDAGEKYYIEVLHKAGTNNDHVEVAWEGPDISQKVIDGGYLSPWYTVFSDFADFAKQWHRTGCASGNGWCNGFDYNHNGSVLFDDLVTFAGTWLVGAE